MRKASWPRFPLQPMSQAAVPKLFRRHRGRGMTWALLLCGLAFFHCGGPSFSCLGGRKLARTRIDVIAVHLRMTHPLLKKCRSCIAEHSILPRAVSFVGAFYLPAPNQQLLQACCIAPRRTAFLAAAPASELDEPRGEQDRQSTWAALETPAICNK